MPSSPVQTLPDVNVPANRAPDVQEQLGAGSIIGMPPARNISPPLQVSKSPASVTTLKPITVNANVDKNVTPCDHVQPTGGDPIVLSTGAKVESATDFSLPGEMGLAFTRYYNSDYFTGSAIRYGVWTTSYDFVLVPNAPNGCAGWAGYPNTCPMAVIRPDGSRVQFAAGQENANGTVSFTQLAGGIATMTQNTDGSYVIHDEDSKIITLAKQGSLLKLQSIKDLAGVGWTISYPDASDMIVTHTSGQIMTLHWVDSSTSGAINRQMIVTDPAGTQYVYNSTLPNGYYSAASGLLIPGELSSVNLPGTPSPTTVSYSYESAPQGGAYQFALTQVAYNGVPHDVTTYNSAGQATQSYLADSTQMYNVSYGSNSTGPTATLTNPLGHISTYQFDTSGDLMSISGQASAHCAATFSSRSYDANGNVSSDTDNDGNVTSYTYAANGEIQQKIENPGANQRVTNFVWDTTPGTDRLLSVTVAGYLQTTFTYTPQGRLASVTQTNLTSNGVANQSRTTSYTYSLYSNGMVSSATTTFPSPNGVTTLTYNYDASGNVTSISNALG
jgi:YD repeat-containing protein